MIMLLRMKDTPDNLFLLLQLSGMQWLLSKKISFNSRLCSRIGKAKSKPHDTYLRNFSSEGRKSCTFLQLGASQVLKDL